MFIVEVQHASDHIRDGLWYPVDTAATWWQADMLLVKYTDPLAYAGRPVRWRELR